MYVVVAGHEHNQDNRQVSKENYRYQLLYPYGVPPDEGL